MGLDITETKLFKEPKETTEKCFPKYRSNWTFESKAFDFINFTKIIRRKEMCNNLLSNVGISYIPMVIYNLNPSTW